MVQDYFSPISIHPTVWLLMFNHHSSRLWPLQWALLLSIPQIEQGWVFISALTSCGQGQVAPGFGLLSGTDCSAEDKKLKQARETAREHDNQTGEVFVERAGPCSCAHLRTQTQLCSLSDLSSGKQQLCRDLWRLLHRVLQSPARCVRGGIHVCLLSQIDGAGRSGPWFEDVRGQRK